MGRKIYRIIAWGGLGDVLLSTPTFAALKKKDPECRIVVFCKTRSHQEIFENNPYVDSIRSTAFFRSIISNTIAYFKLGRFYSTNYGFTLPSLFSRRKAVDIIADLLDVQLENRNLQVFLTEKEKRKAESMLSAYKKPLLLHVSSLTSRNQEWPLENWKVLIDSMPDYSFIQVGGPDDPQVEGAIDLRGKTTFKEALALMANCLSFVGVVSSFAHATNAFNVPGVVLFGASSPEVWGHNNNINIYKDLPCAPCIDLLAGSSCPYSKRCMTQISVADVRNALLVQLKATASIEA
jgi:ADP-heptose:LPS heptosyltransferase